jgi:hypothetical protein
VENRILKGGKAVSRNNPYARGIFLIILLSLFISSLTFAANKDIVTFQGIVMELDWKKKVIIVNERSFAFDQNTIVHNEKGSPIPQDNLKTKTWVYVEGIKDKSQKKLATKIYLLPKYIDEKEKHLYPFIK